MTTSFTLLPQEQKSKAAPAGPSVNSHAGKTDRTLGEPAGSQLEENSGYGRSAVLEAPV